MTATVTVQPTRRPGRQKCAGVDDDCSPKSSRHRVQDAMTLKTCKATQGMKKVVVANAGSTAMPQCSTDRMTPCAGNAATMRREQSDAGGRAGVTHEPYREQTHGCRSCRWMPDMASLWRVRVAPRGVNRQDHLSLVPGRHAATEG